MEEAEVEGGATVVINGEEETDPEGSGRRVAASVLGSGGWW